MNISNFSVTPTIVNREAIVTIAFTLNETTLFKPTVVVGEDNLATLVSKIDNDYIYEYQVKNTDNEGQVNVVVNVRDLSDEVFTFSYVNAFIIDATDPIISNIIISPSIATVGGTIAVTFAVNEPVLQSTVTIAGNEAPYSHTSGTEITHEYVVTGDELDGTASVVITVQDFANNLSEANRTVELRLQAPVIVVDPPSQESFSSLFVTLTSATADTIFYTTDGTDPKTSSSRSQYTSSIYLEAIDGGQVIRAYGVDILGLESSEVIASYTFAEPAVVFSPSEGTYPGAITVGLQLNRSGQVFYTTDNTNPRTSTTRILYTNPIEIPIDESKTIRAIGITDTGIESPISERTYIATNIDGNKDFIRLGQENLRSQIRQTDRTVDTKTVAIIGTGEREEILIDRSIGNEEEGSPINFQPGNLVDGRHFRLKSYPIRASKLRVYIVSSNGTTRILRNGDFDNNGYVVDSEKGYLVLHHPLKLGESLFCRYISENDINAARSFTELEPILEIYGPISSTNTISLGAALAFENGATRVTTLQADIDNDFDWTLAFDALSIEYPYFIVPLPTLDDANFASILNKANNHVKELSQTKHKKERFLISGTKDSLDEFSLITDTERALFLTPNRVSRIVNGIAIELPGYFAAASVAGKYSSLSNIATSLTRKTVTGLNLLMKDSYSDRKAEELAKEGITALQRISGSTIRVWRAVTSDQSRVVEQSDPSLIRIRDYTSYFVRDSLEEKFVGKIGLETLLEDFTDETEELLKRLKEQKIITDFGGVSIAFDSNEPRQVNVSFDIQPMYSIQFISVRISARLN